jgi:two-component system competent response regulator ComA
MSPVNIIIIDDHPAFAVGTKHILEQDADFKVVEIIHNSTKVIESILIHKPHVVLIDLNMPELSGKEVAKQIKTVLPNTQVIIFSGFDLVPMWNTLMQVGVSGILSKNCTPEQLHRMIGAVLSGDTIIPIQMLNRLVYNEDPNLLLQTVLLTDREQQIMELICAGENNQKIAAKLIVSTRSAENYIARIYEKLGVRTRAEAIDAYRSQYFSNDSAG